MLNNTRIINAMKKAGLTVETSLGGYRVVSGDRIVTWHVQGDKAVCVHCTTRNDGRDSMTDYFPGSYARTIKSAVSYLVR